MSDRMPNLSSTVTFEPELRLCKVGDQLGYFHTWEQWSDVIAPSLMRGGHQGGVISQMYALVEFTDGVKRVQPCDIKFIDKNNIFLAKINGCIKEMDEKNSGCEICPYAEKHVSTFSNNIKCKIADVWIHDYTDVESCRAQCPLITTSED